MAEEKADNSDLVINEGPNGKILTRVMGVAKDATHWKTTFTTLKIPVDPVYPKFESDEFTIGTLARKTHGVSTRAKKQTFANPFS